MLLSWVLFSVVNLCSSLLICVFRCLVRWVSGMGVLLLFSLFSSLVGVCI